MNIHKREDGEFYYKELILEDFTLPEKSENESQIAIGGLGNANNNGFMRPLVALTDYDTGNLRIPVTARK